MKITFEQSGGFAGLHLSEDIDTDELKPVEAVELLRLVDDANFFALPELIASPTPQPDRLVYTVCVSMNTGAHTVTVSEEVLPSGLKPLVRWFKERMRRG
jgi:emfourin